MVKLPHVRFCKYNCSQFIKDSMKKLLYGGDPTNQFETIAIESSQIST